MLATVQNFLEYGRRIGDGAADHLQDVGDRCLPFERFFRFGEKAGILDRDDGLLGEGLEQRDLLVAECSLEWASDPQRANAASLEQHRREHDRLSADRATPGARFLRHVFAFDVRVDKDSALQDREAG